MCRIDGQWRQDRINLGVEVIVEKGVLGIGQLLRRAQANPMFLKDRADLALPNLVEACDEVVRAARNFQQLRQWAHAVRRWILRFEVFVKLGLEPGNSNL